ncbi:MAG: hypothetical protein ACFFCW_19815 [Candidatus Hodarchaeota archaeon]
MKKVALVLLLMAWSFGTAFADAPAPFPMIKHYALQGEFDPNYGVWTYEFIGWKENIGEYHIGFVYNPELEVIVILGVINDEATVIRYESQTEQFLQLYFTPFGLVPEEISKEDAIDKAFQIMRQAVNLCII